MQKHTLCAVNIVLLKSFPLEVHLMMSNRCPEGLSLTLIIGDPNNSKSFLTLKRLVLLNL